MRNAEHAERKEASGEEAYLTVWVRKRANLKGQELARRPAPRGAV